MPFKIFQGHSRLLILVPAMRLSTSQYQKRMHIWYRLPDIEDSYADFLCRDGGTSIERVIFEKQGTITKIGMRKMETLRYFQLADSMASPSAVLELFVSESPIFGFCIFRGLNYRTDFGVVGTNLYQIS